MPYLELAPDYKLFYAVDDSTDAWTHPATVVFVHGFAETTEAWRAWVPHLARFYRLVRIDQRGFGKSGPVPDNFAFTTELLVDDLIRVINHVSKEPVHIVCGKSAGISVIKLAVTRPDLVKTITLGSAPLTPPQSQGWIEHMEQHGMRSWARSTMPARLGSKMPPRGTDWWVDMMGSTALSTAKAYLGWASKIDGKADLEHIACPTLVLTTQSPRRTQAEREAYRTLLKNAEIVEIAVDAMYAGGADPDSCARATLEFLNRHS